MSPLSITYRQMRVILHSLTQLRYQEAEVDNIQVSEQEFNELMDNLGGAIGDELRKRELANAHHIDALTPEEDRRTFQIPQGVTAQYPGPDRRDMREKALHMKLSNVHKSGFEWYAEDDSKRIYIYLDGRWLDTSNNGK